MTSWIEERAATLFFKTKEQLNQKEKERLLRLFIQEEVAKRWKTQRVVPAETFYVSMEYNFPKPFLEASQLLGIQEEVDQLSQILFGEEVHMEDVAPKLSFDALGDFAGQKIYSSAESEEGFLGYGLLMGEANHPWLLRRAESFEFPFDGENREVIPYDYPIVTNESVRFVRLWHVEPKENEKDVNTLYPSGGKGDVSFRLVQEMMLAKSVVRDIVRMDYKNSYKIVLFETHGIFVCTEILKQGLERGLSLEEGIRFVQTHVELISTSTSDDVFTRYRKKEFVSLFPNTFVLLGKIDAKRTGSSIVKEDWIYPYLLVGKLGIPTLVSSDSQKKQIIEKLQLEDSSHIQLTAPSFPLRPLKDASSHHKGKNKNKKELFDWKLKKKKEFIHQFGDDSMNPYGIMIAQIANFHENNRILMTLLAIAALHRALRENPHVDIPPMTFVISGLAHKEYWMAQEVQELTRAYAKWLARDNVTKDVLRIIYCNEKDADIERQCIKAADIYQNLQHPKSQSANYYARFAIFHGAGMISAENEFVRQSHQYLGDASPTFFPEETNREEALSLLRFLEEHHSDLHYDIRTVKKLLLQYQDGFSVLGSFSAYKNALFKLIRTYQEGEEWNERRLQGRIRLIDALKNQEVTHEQ